MARKENKEKRGSYVWSFSMDRETHEMIEMLSKSLGINKSAVVRMAVRRLYYDSVVRPKA
ncbi:hypothetical protein P8X24_11545 [Pyrococcus kukulkanii]|uniref:hypothetical protein n=1 Tax=Pyrococcus kukulkanii TaxID=1609559 RepID=UPI003561BA05